MADNLDSLAAVIGENSAASLAFDDPQSAKHTMQSLKIHAHIVGAALYDKNGALFSTYENTASVQSFSAPGVPRTAHAFRGDRLILFHPFDLAGEHAGTVLIESDTRELRARMLRYALIGFVVLVVSSCIAFLLSKRLQQTISEPISHLSGVVDLVRARKDYGVRANRFGNDELGKLIDAFNDMLERISVQIEPCKRDANSSSVASTSVRMNCRRATRV